MNDVSHRPRGWRNAPSICVAIRKLPRMNVRERYVHLHIVTQHNDLWRPTLKVPKLRQKLSRSLYSR
jgi:hypothetical protein